MPAIEVEFHPDPRRYIAPGGRILPGISSRGRAAGLLYEFEGNGFLDPQKGDRIHTAIHYALEGDLDDSTVDPDEYGFVRAALNCIEREEMKPLLTLSGKPAVEYAVGNLDLGYATKVDLLCLWRGKKTVVNWKTSEKVFRWYAWQSALEALLFTPEVVQRLGVHLAADGSYKLEAYTDRGDYVIAKAALTIAAAVDGGKRS